ncbi:MAG TPA: branched-chain amino acid ABC transporter substrate-binding protein [Solirubrobacteraceae bacterium]|nr:branched-chain amino acid ABC transporter substrate-binding protein [Solirubrobacteraceae bacterium]HLM86751.1 branched-chain amino acid ABC transporter substrate-binding protein [Solirubrobacteraceae bacterium]
MLARGLGLIALAAVLLGAVGCGGVAVSDVAEATGGQLTIYSSEPLQGLSSTLAQQVVDGEKLALSDAGGHAGPFKIGFVSLNDANPASGQWSPAVTETNAKIAAQDTSAIAFLGDLDSGATAVSLPLMNAAGVLQVSPASPYVGLTSSLDAGQDEPERFYPSGKRTFIRLQPGDTAQAQAQVQLMRALHVRRLYVLDDQNPFEQPLANLLAGDAERAGIEVIAHDSVSTAPEAVFTGEVEKIVERGAQAVFLAGGEGAGTAALWRDLHEADPHLLLFGPSSMASEAFTSQIGAAGAHTYLTTPVLPARLYPSSAQQVLRHYRSAFGAEGGAYALYGYEAMTLVLDGIRDAGARGNDRQTVIDRVFATRGRNSLIGRYSIEPDGETTLSRYGVERVRHGRPVFERVLELGAG